MIELHFPDAWFTWYVNERYKEKNEKIEEIIIEKNLSEQESLALTLAMNDFEISYEEFNVILEKTKINPNKKLTKYSHLLLWDIESFLWCTKTKNKSFYMEETKEGGCHPEEYIKNYLERIKEKDNLLGIINLYCKRFISENEI